MLNLRIRPVNDDGSTGENTRVIATQQITYTGVFNSVSTISFDVSRDDWQPTAYPFVVRVEYSTGGRYVPLPEHDLFIIERDSDDSKDAGRIVTYKGIAYVPWILAGTYVGDGPWNDDGERTIDNGPANAGRIFDYFFTESTSRGPWLKYLEWNFNGTRDSANVLWKTEDREEFAWRVDQHWYGEMLAQLADQSLCEWTVKGTELQLFRPGTRGVDRSESIQLGGPRFDRVPVETDTQGQFTHVVSTYDEGRTWTTNTDAEARFGRRSVAVSHTGVKTAAGSQRLAQKLLAGGQEVKREEAYEWTPTSGDVSPFRDFSLGDLVSAVSRGAKKSRRVIGVIITQSADGVTVQARVGERISTLAAKNQKALEAVTGGSIPGGTGGTFPTVSEPVKSIPQKPVGLHVVKNIGMFTSVGPRAEVELAWSPVTSTVTGETVAITTYAVLIDEVEFFRTTDTNVTVELVSSVTSEYRVIAYAGSERRSDPSDIVSVTGAFPIPIDLIPSEPILTTSHGNVVATWDGEYTTPAIDGSHTVRVEARVQGTGPWIMQGAALDKSGEQLVSVGAIGDTVEVRFTAYDQLGRPTGTSEVASIKVQGVEFADFDTAARERIEGIEGAVEAVEAGQVIIGRTVEGLNRRFQSIESPGRGYLGFHNLAPAIVGSREWVEVRRNLDRRPDGSGVTALGPAFIPYTLAGVEGTLISSTWNNANSLSVLGADVEEGRYISSGVTLAAMSPEMVGFTFGLQIHDGERYVSPRTYVTLGEVGVPVRVETPARDAVVAGRTLRTYLYPDVAMSGQPELWVGQFLSEWVPQGGLVGAHFDGSSPDFSVDPDMRTRWLGAENASESVMEIEAAAGFFSTTGCIAGFSTQMGFPTIRQIVTGGNPFAQSLAIAPAGGVHTALATAHVKDPLPGLSVPYLRLQQPVVDAVGGNSAGDYSLRAQSSLTESLNRYQLRISDGPTIGTEVHWSDIQLYAGNGPGPDALKFHKGDVWEQLGWPEEADQTDPDQLVILHIWTWNGQDWVARDWWGENIFAAGSVTARVLNADEIYANEAHMNVLASGLVATDEVTGLGNSLNITANQSIELAVGRQDATDQQLSELRSDVDGSIDAAEHAATVADEAHVAALAAGADLVAQNSRLVDVETGLSDQQAHFKILPGGVQVAFDDQSASLDMTPESIRFMSQGTAVAEISQEAIIIHKGIFEQAQIGNHLMQKKGNRTTFTPIEGS